MAASQSQTRIQVLGDTVDREGLQESGAIEDDDQLPSINERLGMLHHGYM